MNTRAGAVVRPWLAVPGAVILAATLLSGATILLDRRQAALAEVRAGAEDLALKTAEQTARSVQAVDIVLLDLQMHATEGGHASAGVVRATVAGPGYAAWIRNGASHLPQIEALLVAGADGHVIVSAGSLPAARQAALAADAARHFADTPDDELFVGAPASGDPDARRGDTPAGDAAPGSAPWLVTLSRAVALPDGNAVAVVAAVLRLDAFGTLYAIPHLAENGLVALLHHDGTLLLRQPPLPPGRRQVPADNQWHAVVAQGGGTYRSHGVFDDRERLVAVRTVPAYPLVTAVGVDENAALAAWRRDAVASAAAAAGAVAFILLLLTTLRRQFRRLQHSQASLEAANQHLSRKSRELETTLAHMDQGLMVIDADGTVPVCNRRAMEMLDLPPDLFARRPTFEQVLAWQWSTDEFRHTAPDLQAFIRAGGLLERPQTYERSRPNGRMIEVRSVPLAGGGLVRTYTDTTARVLGEQRFRQIVDDCPLAIALLSTRDGRFVQVNPACCALVGRSADDLTGRRWQDIVHPGDHHELAGQHTLDHGRVTLEARLLTRTGGVVWTRLTRSLLPAPPGRRKLVLVIGEDVTPQRELQARLRQAQRLEAVGQLTGGVAHDFNNLLAIIMLDAEMLAEASADDPERGRLADEILATAGSGAELTRRLLAFARRQTLQPTSMDLNAHITEAANLLSRTLGEAFRVRLELAADLWPLRADASQVGDALLNLALNARDAMPEGGDLTIATANVTLPDAAGSTGSGSDAEPARLSVPAVANATIRFGGFAGLNAGDARSDLPAGSYVALTVSDTGSGMTAEVLERAVEPFFTTKPPGSGSGLGLSMIYGFARQSGGTLILDSTPGRGTSVRLLLPRARAGTEQTHGEAAPGDLPGGRETVLLVDDNDAVRHVAVRQLQALGYAVREAECGPAALAVLHSDARVDLLFTDIVMPGGMSGVALAQAARQVRPLLKVLFTTGFAQVATDAEDGGRGPDPRPMLRKPFRRQALAEKVRAVLDA